MSQSYRVFSFSLETNCQVGQPNILMKFCWFNSREATLSADCREFLIRTYRPTTVLHYEMSLASQMPVAF